MRSRKDEEGSALVMALVFVTVVSLLIGITLTFAEASVKYGDRVAESRTNLYTADGILEAAIDKVEAGRPCDSSFTLNGVKPTATCVPPAKSSPSSARPDRAILTLGNSPEGIIQSTASKPLTIGGDVFSRSVITGNDAGITVDGQVAALGTCTGVTATPSEDKYCSGDPAPVTPIAGPDPGYMKATSVFPDYKTVPGPPVCTPEVTLQPGYYDNAEALTELTDGDGICNSDLIYFEPGNYYFDFDYQALTPCTPDESKCVWTVNDTSLKVIGGAADSPAEPLVPGACSEGDPGVQFIFGGQSRMEVLNGKVELCPRAAATGPRISVYGIPSGPVPTQVDLPAAEPTQAISTTFTEPSPNRAIGFDDDPARAPLDTNPPNATPTASVILKGFGFAIPMGSRIISTSLRVDHVEGEPNVLDIAATVTPGNGPSLPAITLRDDCTVELCSEFKALTLSAAQLNGIEITYTAALTTDTGPHLDSIDGVSLTVKYVPPSFEPLAGCHAPVYPNASPLRCALIKASGQAVLAVGGTVYAPTAAVDADLDTISVPVFGRGVIARTVHLGVNAAGTPAIVDLPPIGPGRALTALGTGGADGLYVTGDPLVVNGDVSSRSQISVIHPGDGKGLTVNGTVKANGTCDSDEIEVVSRPPSTPTCGPGTVGPEIDPGYQPPVLADLPARDPPSCGSTDDVVRIQPGLYEGTTDAAGLLALTSATGGCNAKVVWLEPGAYYFNFDPTGLFGCDSPPGNACNWVIDRDVRVVGGQPSGWDPGPDPGPVPPGFDPSQVNFPGGCDAGVSAGVNIVFGGPSRIDLREGSLELCAGTDVADQPVAVYGFATPTAGYQPLSGCLVLATESANACSLITTDTASSKIPRLAVQGIVYGPGGSVDVKVVDVSTPVFGQGVIARAISLDVTPKECVGLPGSTCYEGPAVVGLREGILSTIDKAYTFTAFVNGRPRTRARVTFKPDPGGGQTATIRSWSVLP